MRVPGLSGSRVYVVAQKNPDEPVAVAVVVDLKGTAPSQALKAIIKKEIADVPLIKNYAADLIVEYATGEVPFVKDEKLQKLLSNYVRHGKVTTQGILLVCFYVLGIYHNAFFKGACKFIVFFLSVSWRYMRMPCIWC